MKEKKYYQQLIVLFLGLCTFNADAIAKDSKDVNGSDHPLISRFPGTYISYYHQSDYDGFLIATDKLDAVASQEQLPPVFRGEGKTTTIEYYPKSNQYSVVQIFRNYETAFNKLGLETVFSCAGDEACGRKFIPQLYWYGNKKRKRLYRNFDAPNLSGRNAEYRYWSGKGRINGKDYYVSLVVGRVFSLPVVTMLDVNEIESLNTEQITIDLDGLTKAVDSSGRVVLDGIWFDTNRTNIKEESLETISVIASYLKANSEKKFYVVGHTDSDGTYSFNVNLSSGRAASVVDALVKQGVPIAQLQAIGVGPVNPVSKNDTDGNKAKNRRVELVEM